MGKQPKPELPDEDQIEALLSQFKPHPSPRFERMMRGAPWIEATSPSTSGASRSWLPRRKYAWAMTAGLLVVFLLAVLFIPSVRAIARQIINSFIFAPTNQLNVQVTLSNPNELFNYTDPQNFPLGVEEARKEAGFEVKQLSSLPEGLALVGARFDRQYYSVTLLYAGPDYQLLLTQRPLGNGTDVFSIGSEAQVKLVMIGTVQAEFVTGGWRAVSTQPAPGNGTPSTTVNISAVWDESLPQSTLRWQQDGYAYELRSLGEGGLAESELINLANGLQ